MLTLAQMLEALKSRVATKGVSTVASLGASKLNDEQADRYIRMLQNKAVVLPQARLYKMRNATRKIDRVGFASRILTAPPNEGAAFDVANAVAPTFEQRTLTAVKAMGVGSLTDELLEENLEKKNFEQTFIDMMAERVGLDIEEWGILGDTDSGDTLLALNDGWLKLCGRVCVEEAAKEQKDTFTTGGAETTQVLDHSVAVPLKIYATTGYWQLATGAYPGAGGDTIVARDNGDGTIVEAAASGISGTIDYYSGDVTLAGLANSTQYYWKYEADYFDLDGALGGLSWPENMFERMLVCIPEAHRKDFQNWRFWVPWHCENSYRNLLKARGTALGDSAQTGMNKLVYKQVPVEVVPSMPVKKAWLSHPDNTVYGIQRDITMEPEREAKAQRTDMVNSVKPDFEYENAECAIRADW